MGKRGAENSQLSKEEYEAAERDREAQDEAQGQMLRAPEEELRKRRIIRAKRDSDNIPAGAGAFAGVNLISHSSSSTKSWSSSKTAPASITAKGFSFAAPANTATTNPSTFAFGTAPAASTTQLTSVSFGATSASATSAPAGEVERLENQRKEDLFNAHKDIVSTTEVHEKERLIYKAIRNIRKFKKVIFDATESTPSVASDTTALAPSAGTSAAASMAASTLASTSPATSNGGFSFGAATTPAASSTTVPSSSAGLSFGAASKADSSSTKPSSSGGFSFGAAATPATTSALASPVNNTTASATDPAPNDGEPSDEIPTTQAGAVVQQVADPDWDDIGSFERITIYRDDNGAWTPLLQKTNLRLQTFKTDSSRHRMIARTMMGKVAVNMSIQSGMGFTFAEKPTKRGPVGTILFVGTNDIEKGPEKFMIKTGVDNGKQLKAKLDELCSN